MEKFPDIFRWLLYFESKLPSSDSAHEDVAILTGVLCFYSAVHELRRTIADTPGTVELAVRLWLRGGSSNEFNTFDVTMALASLIRSPEPEWLDRAIMAAPSNNTTHNVLKISQVALFRINEAVQTLPIDHGRVTFYLNALGMLASGHENVLRHATLFLGGILIIIHALIQLSKLPVDGVDQDKAESVAACLIFLHNNLESIDGATCINQALRAGLLVAIIKCSLWIPFFAPDKASMALPNKILDMLQRYLVYRSVIKEIVKSMRHAAVSEYRKMIATSAFYTDWLYFRRLAFEAMLLKDAFDEIPETTMPCNNDEVSH